MTPIDLTNQLVHLLPSDTGSQLRAIAQVADQLNTRAYLVGGAVRDAVMGDDWPGTRPDVSVIGPIAPFVEACQNRIHGSRIRYISAYSTARLDIGDRAIELATARRDKYDPPGSMPQVTPVASIEEDLPRRDFTVNAMAVELNPDGFGSLIDPLAGVADCQNRVLRLTRGGCGSFRDDPTRILRGVKLGARCRLQLEPTTAAELRAALPGLSALYETQPKRVWKEWRQFFDPRENLRSIFELADELGVLRALQLTWRDTARKEWLDLGAVGVGFTRFGATLRSLRWSGILTMYRLMPLPNEWRKAIWTALDDAKSSRDPEDSTENLDAMRTGLEIIDGEIARQVRQFTRQQPPAP